MLLVCQKESSRSGRRRSAVEFLKLVDSLPVEAGLTEIPHSACRPADILLGFPEKKEPRMKISVLIPAYNSSATIDATIRSVLAQSLLPFEVLVLDDGSTDETYARLQAYAPQVTAYRCKNGGSALARNFLCAKAQGDAIAFLDADDVWHPEYLKTQAKILGAHPSAVAGFVGYVTFRNDASLSWPNLPAGGSLPSELLSSLTFFQQYNQSPIHLVPSCCFFPRRIMPTFGAKPFPEGLAGAEDFYFFNSLSTRGPVAVCPTRLVGYRQTPGSLGSDRLLNTGGSVKGMQLLAEKNSGEFPRTFARAFALAFASRRRRYARHLMGGGKPAEAREQIRLSLARSGSLASAVKSVGLYLCTLLPRALQPKWPGRYREA